MFYQLQILLIVILFLLGSYELFQLTKLGSRLISYSRISIKLFNRLILTKKAWRNIYKYQIQ